MPGGRHAHAADVETRYVPHVFPHDPPLVRPAVGLLVIRRGALLLGRRTGGSDPGTWGVPGGKIDYGEDLFAAATRELLEEAGSDLVVTRPRLLPIAVHDLYPERGEQYSTHLLVAEWVSGEARVMERGKCLGWRWWPWGSLPHDAYAGARIARERYPNPAEMVVAASYGL